MAQTAQPADITAAQAVLKEVYPSDAIEEQVVNNRFLLSQIERTSDYTDDVGDKAIMYIRTQSNPRASSRSLNGGTLGAPGRTERKRTEWDLTAHYIQIKILGTTIAKMKTSRQAAVREIDDEVSDATEGLKDDIQRQLYGNGDALIAQCGTTTASATIQLNAAEQATAKGWLKVNQYVDIGTAADEDSVVADALILAVDPVNHRITIDSAVTTGATHFVSIADNRSGTTSYEMNGLGNLTSDTSVFGALDPATTPLWKGTRVNAGGALGQAKMQDAWISLYNKGARPDFILTSAEHQRDYYNTLQSQVRFQGDTNLSAGHLDGPDFNGVKVVADQDAPDGAMYFITKKTLMMFTASDNFSWTPHDASGSLLHLVQGEDAYMGMCHFYGNLGSKRRLANGVLYGLT